jgi:hypothetical protein
LNETVIAVSLLYFWAVLLPTCRMKPCVARETGTNQ